MPKKKDDNTVSKLIQKLIKIKKLTKSPNEGEALAAKNQFQSMLKKYNLSEDDFNTYYSDEAQKLYEKKIPRELMYLFEQLVCYVICENRTWEEYLEATEGWSKKNKTKYIAFLTTKEIAELEDLFETYSASFKKESELFARAFLSKNKLIHRHIEVDSRPTEDWSIEELEEIRKRESYANQITETNMQKKLKGG